MKKRVKDISSDEDEMGEELLKTALKQVNNG